MRLPAPRSAGRCCRARGGGGSRWAMLDDPAGCSVDRPVVGLDGAVDETLVETVDGLHGDSSGSVGWTPNAMPETSPSTSLESPPPWRSSRGRSPARVDRAAPGRSTATPRPIALRRRHRRGRDPENESCRPANDAPSASSPGADDAPPAARTQIPVRRSGARSRPRAGPRRAGIGCGSAAPCPRSPPSACRRSSCGRVLADHRPERRARRQRARRRRWSGRSPGYFARFVRRPPAPRPCRPPGSVVRFGRREVDHQCHQSKWSSMTCWKRVTTMYTET